MLLNHLLPALALLGSAAAEPHGRRTMSKEHQRLAIAKRAAAEHSELTHTHWKRFTGTGTFYYTSTMLSACGQWTSDDSYIVALNSAQYGSGYPGPQCFKTLSLTANGVTVGGVVVMDECPTCGFGDLDLSPGLFRRFASESAGVISISWEWEDGSSQTTEEPKPESTTSQWVEPTPTPTSSETTTWSTSTTSETPTTTSSSTTSSSSGTTMISSTSSLNATVTASLNSTISASRNSTNTTLTSSTAAINTTVTKPLSAAAAAQTQGVSIVTGEGGEDTAGQGLLGDVNSFVARIGNLIVAAALGAA